MLERRSPESTDIEKENHYIGEAETSCRRQELVLGGLNINKVVETGFTSPRPVDDVSKVINGNVRRAVKPCTHWSNFNFLCRLSENADK